MLDLSLYTTATFPPAFNTFLADKTSRLAVGATALLEHLTPGQISAYIETRLPDRPRWGQHAADVLPLLAPGAGKLAMLGAGFAFAVKRRIHAGKLRPIHVLISEFTVERPVISLTDRERALLRGLGGLVAEQHMQGDEWCRALAILAWADGKGSLVPDEAIALHPKMAEVRDHLAQLLKHTLPPYEAFLAEVAARIAGHASQHGGAAAVIRDALQEGARWMTDDDLSDSPFVTTQASPAALLIGYTDSDTPVYFDGNESILTVGGPGSGKSAQMVTPNLHRFPGSVIVLDIKGELFEQTAGYRAKHFGKVYRFAPTDPRGSDRFNPFDVVSRDPNQAADDCADFSYQVVVDNPRLHDPYWESKGRDFIWAYAMAVALKAPPHLRNIESLAEYVSLPLIDEPDQPIITVIEGLTRLAATTGIPDLAASAHALKGGLSGTRLESVMDTARRYLAPFARSGHARRAMSASDWSPEELRKNPGTSLYICMSPSDLKVFAPLVRLVLHQHMRILMNYAVKPGEPPITFFLDEMPKLGNFGSILEMQDIGRSAGLRLWMFAQHLGQLSEAFGKDRYMGVVEACRVRQFMQPDTEAAQHLSTALGQVKNVFTGETKPLAEPYELMGRRYHDKSIVTVRGDLPMALGKKFAPKHLILPAPPIKKKAPPRP